jgi:hypothetical protein
MEQVERANACDLQQDTGIGVRGRRRETIMEEMPARRSRMHFGPLQSKSSGVGVRLFRGGPLLCRTVARIPEAWQGNPPARRETRYDWVC